MNDRARHGTTTLVLRIDEAWMKIDDAKFVTPSQGEPAEGALPSKLAYSKPVLRHLGSVRELTLGSPTGGFNDCKGGFKATKGCP